MIEIILGIVGLILLILLCVICIISAIRKKYEIAFSSLLGISVTAMLIELRYTIITQVAIIIILILSIFINKSYKILKSP